MSGETSASVLRMAVHIPPNPALEPTAASGLRRLAVPSALRASAAAQRER